MEKTTNYNLKKPQYNEYADIMDINENMDIVDQILNGFDERLKRILTKDQTDLLYAKIAHRHNVNDIDNLIPTIKGTKVNNAIQSDNAEKLRNMIFNWSGQGGQPSWVWGGADGTNMFVYNPANFNVNYANSAGNVNSVHGFQFRNNNGRLEVLINGVWLSVGGRQYTVVRQGKLNNNRFDYSGGAGIIRYAQSSYKYGKTGYARVIVDGVDIEQSISNGGLQVIQDVEFKNSVSMITTTGDIDYLIQTEK
jgi:putative uncharacterized protein orf14|nr:MAG TPA: hypothetical protein [Caudoviricetes sp.]